MHMKSLRSWFWPDLNILAEHSLVMRAESKTLAELDDQTRKYRSCEWVQCVLEIHVFV